MAPPETARAEALLTTPCCGSRPPKCPSRVSSRWCSSAQMPASAHSVNRRQQVEPETPKASRESIYHCRTDLRMKMIPRRPERSSADGRPSYNDGPGRGGRRGEISSPSLSGSSSTAIASPPCVAVDRDDYRLKL